GTSEVLALLAGPVRGTRRPVRVGHGENQEFLLQMRQAMGQDVRRDARQRLDEVVEPSGTLEQRLNEQHRPAVAHPGHRRGKRRYRRVAHWLMVAAPPKTGPW